MKVEQGQIVFLNFPFNDGSGAKVRPAVVLQSNRENQRLASTVVAMISSNLNLIGREPGHILIDPQFEEGRQSGLKYPSAVNIHAIHTIHTDRIERIAGQASHDLLQNIHSTFIATFDIQNG